MFVSDAFPVVVGAAGLGPLLKHCCSKSDVLRHSQLWVLKKSILADTIPIVCGAEVCLNG